MLRRIQRAEQTAKHRDYDESRMEEEEEGEAEEDRPHDHHGERKVTRRPSRVPKEEFD